MEALAPRAPAAPRPRLRVGVFVDSRWQPRWVAEALRAVAGGGCARIVALAEAGEEGARAPALWKAYEWLDRRAFGSGPDECKPVDLGEAVRGVVHLPLLGEESAVERLADWRQAIAGLDLDVALAFGEFDDLVLEGLVRHGVWRVGFDESAGYGSSLPGVDEIASGSHTSSSALVMRLPDGERRVAWRSWSRTFDFSLVRSRDELLRKTACFPARALAELHRSGERWLETRDILPTADSVRRDARADARNLHSLARIAAGVARRSVQKARYVEQWFVGFAFGEAAASPADLGRFQALMPPTDRYWADPFPLVRGGRCYIFFEELLFATGKAHISVVEVDRAGNVSAPRAVLACGYHLSYPFLLEDEGELYMIPETAAANRVEMWRCTEFPHRWERHAVLLEGVRAVDATVCQHAGRWWLFANVAAEGASLNDELHLYSAPHLAGPWTPHPANPVKSDVRGSRPAGRIYRRNGRLFRPAQVCAPLYGSGVAIHRIEKLTEHEYSERLVETIVPTTPEGILGLHTLNREGDFCVVDGFVRRRRA